MSATRKYPIKEVQGVKIQHMTPFSINHDPYVIWPYYTGRDKGVLRGDEGAILTFFSDGYAWQHIFTVVQPNDDRACTNYKVVRLSEYLGA